MRSRLNGHALVAFLRPLVLCALITGVALTLVVGTSSINPTPVRAQVGYGSESGPFAASSLFIKGNQSGSGLGLILAIALGVALIVVAGLAYLRRRRNTPALER